MTLRMIQIDRYHRDGFVVVPALLGGPALDDLRASLDAIEAATPATGGAVRGLGPARRGPRPARTDDFLARCPAVRALLASGPVRDAASALLGEGTSVLEMTIRHRRPGATGYRARQDAPARDFDGRRVGCLVAIEAANVANGCPWLAPGVHRAGVLGPDPRGNIPASTAAGLDWQPVTLEPGDALLWSPFTPHWSAPNFAASPWRALEVAWCRARRHARRRGRHPVVADTGGASQPASRFAPGRFDR